MIPRWPFNTTIIILAGAAVGILLLYAIDLPQRWLASCVSALLIAFSLAATKNPKRILITIYFIALPVITYNFRGQLSVGHIGGPPGFFYTFLDFIFIIMLTLLLGEKYINSSIGISLTRIEKTYLMFIGICLASVLNTYEPRLSIYELIRIFIIFIVFIYISHNIKSKYELNLALRAAIIGLAAESVLGVFQFIQQKTLSLSLIGEPELLRPIAPGSNILRASGTLGDPNSFSLYLGILTPIAISMLFLQWKGQRKIYFLAVCLTAISAMIGTMSRAGWITFIISVFMMFYLTYKSTIKYKYIKIVGIVSLAVIIAPALLFMNVIRTRAFSDDYKAAYSRVPLAKVAINTIKANPFIGVGLNNYSDVMANYDNTPERITSRFKSVVHNTYLLIAAEIGIPGLICFLWLMFLIWKEGLELLKTTKDRYICGMAIGTLSGISGFLLHILFEPTYLSHHVFYILWVIIGLLISLKKLDKANRNSLHEKYQYT